MKKWMDDKDKKKKKTDANKYSKTQMPCFASLARTEDGRKT